MENSQEKKIVVQKDGPFQVFGNIPLVRKEQVVSEYGEPLLWKMNGIIQTRDYYELCRCGHSKEKPFCDCSHFDANFDGTENAETTLTEQRQEHLAGAFGIDVRRDHSLCTESGFCGTRNANIDELVKKSGDTQVRSLIMAMIDRCPSGSLVYSLEKGGMIIEPDLPIEIAVTTEVISKGPIEGPLWVTGRIPIFRADGQYFEIRNRVTLCTCGESSIKPLCDGAHRKKMR